MKRLFVDTGVWIGALSPRDATHEIATQVIDRILDGEWASVHVSDHVVAETLNYIRKKIRDPRAAQLFLDHIFGSDDVPPLVTSVLRVHSARFAAALERYQKEFDRGLSFTDWTIAVVMQDEDIRSLATFDSGFGGLVAELVPG